MDSTPTDSTPTETDSRESLERRILEIAEPFSEIAVLVLFGSRARGTARPDSDLDVAVVPSTEDSRVRFHLRNQLAAALAELSPEGKVDVVLLDEVPELLRQRVMEHGRLLLVRDESLWRDLRVRTMREHGDREWVRRLQRRSLRDRLTKGEPSGRSGRAVGALERLGWISR